MTPRLLIWAAACAAACAVQAECLTDAQAADLVSQYMAKAAAVTPMGLSDADGACSRAKVNALLEQRVGPVIGYKAGLTNAAMQQQFGYGQPVWGKLYQGMVLTDGATVEAAFGARPLFEADMLVRVSSRAINRAKTPMDVMQSIDQIIPFIELPDFLVKDPPQLDGASLSAINAAARLGVAGQPIWVPLTRVDRYALLDALRDMNVVLNEGMGIELGRGKGSDILGHPFNAVVWLAQALAKEGLEMKPGDLISLGSLSPLLPPMPGLKATASYQGLPGAMPVSVRFK